MARLKCLALEDMDYEPGNDDSRCVRLIQVPTDITPSASGGVLDLTTLNQDVSYTADTYHTYNHTSAQNLEVKMRPSRIRLDRSSTVGWIGLGAMGETQHL